MAYTGAFLVYALFTARTKINVLNSLCSQSGLWSVLNRCNPDGSKCGAACHAEKHALIWCCQALQAQHCVCIIQYIYVAQASYISILFCQSQLLEIMTLFSKMNPKQRSSPTEFWCLSFHLLKKGNRQRVPCGKESARSFDRCENVPVLLSCPILSQSTDASACLAQPHIAFYLSLQGGIPQTSASGMQ